MSPIVWENSTKAQKTKLIEKHGLGSRDFADMLAANAYEPPRLKPSGAASSTDAQPTPTAMASVSSSGNTLAEPQIIEDWMGISKKLFDQIVEAERKALSAESSDERTRILDAVHKNRDLHRRIDNAITVISSTIKWLR